MNTIPTDEQLIEILTAAQRGELKVPWPAKYVKFIKDHTAYLLSDEGVAHIEELRAQLNSRTDRKERT